MTKTRIKNALNIKIFILEDEKISQEEQVKLSHLFLDFLTLTLKKMLPP